jgi:UDP-3-O-[3-hydroxymyristoyl] glucosamine N-acyltransferase
MPVILSPSQAPTLTALLDDIAQAKALVSSIEPGTAFDDQTRIQGIGALASCSGQEISFIVSAKFQHELNQTAACAVILPPELAAPSATNNEAPYARVICSQPYLLYALIAHWFDQKRQPSRTAGIHPSAVVDESASVDSSAVVGPHVVIGAHSVIEAGVTIHPNVVIGAHCRIGADGIIYPRVTLYDHVRIGQRAILHAGVVLGADGFGFAPNPMLGQGAWGKIAQLGGVLMGDDVEIGANTTIDRGALEDTVIGNGVKLDNQIMIGHNCHIGEHTAMAACVGVAGSTRIGARCIIGGAAMFSGHITIADDVQISGGTAITSDISKAGRYTGVLPAAPHGDWQRNAAVIGQLAQLRKRLRDLERSRPENP